jgi:hypothetical protein
MVGSNCRLPIGSASRFLEQSKLQTINGLNGLLIPPLPTLSKFFLSVSVFSFRGRRGGFRGGR